MKNIKKQTFWALISVLCITVIIVTGCGESDNSDNDDDFDSERNSAAAENDIDLDLSVMNDTMMTAAIDNVYNNPNDYIGKTIKMTGQYTSFYDEQSDEDIHQVIVFDESSCCSKGFEFKRADGFVYPDDFPEQDEIITVIGTLKKYRGENWLYLDIGDMEL